MEVSDCPVFCRKSRQPEGVDSNERRVPHLLLAAVRGNKAGGKGGMRKILANTLGINDIRQLRQVTSFHSVDGFVGFREIQPFTFQWLDGLAPRFAALGEAMPCFEKLRPDPLTRRCAPPSPPRLAVGHT
jgi:hypothetical protein